MDYSTCMNSMFRRYGHLDENIKLGILTRNSAPFYSTQILTVSTMQEFEDACLELEVKKFKADSYVPLSRRRYGYVDPDLAFISVPSSSTSSNQLDIVSEVRPIEAIQPSALSGMVVCWNCERSGHHRHSYPEPKKLLCYRCGKMDVTVRTVRTIQVRKTTSEGTERSYSLA
ncbi:hypothetical protein HHI36_008458 [Cryptolaemus montrouzieri]|uniref:Uncharacterized protein n=1 Tax=Cryptolaemus montrouzieri TaxID=559131 RepID=A0ABD2MSI2_9CUCU